MKTPSASLEFGTKVLRYLTLLAVASLLIGLLFALPGATPAQGEKAAEEAKLRHDWHMSMMKVPHPKKKGTFEATYPNKVWREVKSIKAPHIPMVPARGGPRPLIVGNTNN